MAQRLCPESQCACWFVFVCLNSFCDCHFFGIFQLQRIWWWTWVCLTPKCSRWAKTEREKVSVCLELCQFESRGYVFWTWYVRQFSLLFVFNCLRPSWFDCYHRASPECRFLEGVDRQNVESSPERFILLLFLSKMEFPWIVSNYYKICLKFSISPKQWL